MRRTFRPGKKKKLSFMGIAPVNAGITSGESASASGKQRLMEKISSVNAGIASGESATASEVNIPYFNQNSKYTDRRKKGADPDESDV